MKLRELHIEGFRSLKSVTWKPGDLNVVIGPNASGKSNLLKALELISASAQGRLSKYVQSEGGMGAILWDGAAGYIKFGLSTEPGTLDPESPDIYGLTLNRHRLPGSYSIEDELLRSWKAPFGIMKQWLERYKNDGKMWDPSKPDQMFMLDEKAGISQDETLLSELSNPRFYPAFAPYVAGLHSWSIYHDVRTDRDAGMRSAPVSHHEQRVSSTGENLINVLHTLYTSDRDFKRDLDLAMKAAFGEEFEEMVFPPVSAADQRVDMRVRWKSLKRAVPIVDLSDGTLRFLFLITVLTAPNPPALIAIDVPETGLHPSMLPIVAELAIEASRNTQVVFTTHSDQFLEAFRDTRPTTTVAQMDEGQTTLKVLDDEELAYWLKEYTLGELFRTGHLEQMD